MGMHDGRVAFGAGIEIPVGASSKTHELKLQQGAQLTLACGPEARWLAFELFLDGAFLELGALNAGFPEATFTVPPGRLEVRVEGHEHDEWVRTIDLAAGDEGRLRIDER